MSAYAYLPDDVELAKLERWLGEPALAFADRCEHAAKALWRQAHEDRERRENNLRASRRLADFARELRAFAA